MSIGLYRVILGPHVSEKAATATEKRNQYVFKVSSTSNKYSIKAAVEKLFAVSVDSVQVLNVKAKSKRFGKNFGTRSGWKKAYVRLAAGQSIDLTQAQI